jgi:PST family polysaccharide transporter
MGTDYYPRLVGVINDKDKTKSLVCDQIMIGLLLIFPLLIAFIIFSPFLIKLLFSTKFLSLVFFLKTVMLGMLFRVCSWSLGYVIIANNDSKLLFFSSTIFAVFMLILNIYFYFFFGIDGLGVSYAIVYFFHLFWNGFIVYKKYNLLLNEEIIKYLSVLAFFVFSCYFISIFYNSVISTIGLCLLLLLSSVFTLYQLEKRSGLITVIKNKIKLYEKKNNKDI